MNLFERAANRSKWQKKKAAAAVLGAVFGFGIGSAEANNMVTCITCFSVAFYCVVALVAHLQED